MSRAYLPPDISYCLESSAEIADIFDDTMTYYHLFNQSDIASEIDNQPHNKRDIGESLRDSSRIFLRHYNEWFFTKADPHQRVWCLRAASETFHSRSLDFFEHLIRTYVSDAIKQNFDFVSPTNRSRWLERNRRWTHFEKNVSQLARKSHLIDGDLFEQACHRPETFYALVEPTDYRTSQIEFVEQDTEWFDNHRTEMLTQIEQSNEWLAINPPKKNPGVSRKLTRQIIRQQRSVLKKSSLLLSRVIGRTQTSAFIRGDQIEIQGQQFTFVLEKNNLASNSWQALKISVHDRKLQQRVFDLCWYVEQTPAMDQLVALALAVKSGNELDIIEVGNKLRVASEAYEADHLKPYLPEPFDLSSPVSFDLYARGTEEAIQANPQAVQAFYRAIISRLRLHRFSNSVRPSFRLTEGMSNRPRPALAEITPLNPIVG